MVLSDVSQSADSLPRKSPSQGPDVFDPGPVLVRVLVEDGTTTKRKTSMRELMLKTERPVCGTSFLLTLLLFVCQAANLWQELTTGRAASAGQEGGLKRCD